ncbi:hypothetical protein QE152_g36558 [Popillia japonica]|uniref:DUF4806 domain-containing protein n=1 Tax=Popillia japonica TaxID=7064 RepID=A0AAW1ICI1_POPJA
MEPIQSSSSTRLEKLLRKGENPDATWNLYKVHRRFFETDDFIKAKEKIKKTEYTSDLATENEESEPRGIRKINRPKRFLDFGDSSSEEDTLQPILQRPPKIVADVNLIHKDYSADDIRSGNTIITTTPQSINSKVSLLPTEKTFTDSDFQKKVITYLSYLKEQNSQILKLLQNQQNASVPPSPHLLPEDLPINIPLNNKESVDIFEQYLSDNRKAEILCIYFSTLGGRNDITSKTNVILRNIMTDFLAAQYSFHGSRNAKNSFVELNLHTVILRAVQTNLPNSTQHEIDNNIKSWLKHAPQRLKFKQANLKFKQAKTNKNN